MTSLAMREYEKHYDQKVTIPADPQKVFSYCDDFHNFSSHMNESSIMMGGARMTTDADEGNGQQVGSHIHMSGTVFGANLYLDEVILKRDPPRIKTWETVGSMNLLVIDHYQLGFEITPQEISSQLSVFIDYNLPTSWKTRLFGKMFGGMYAKWCVGQMAQGAKDHFEKGNTS